MEDRAFLHNCLILVVEDHRKNSNGLWMFSEVAHNEQEENRPWDKIWFLWASEKTKPWFLIIIPKFSRHKTRDSDVKDSSAKRQPKLQQNHTENALRIQFSLAENSWKTNTKITEVKFYFPKYKGFSTQNFLFIPDLLRPCAKDSMEAHF